MSAEKNMFTHHELLSATTDNSTVDPDHEVSGPKSLDASPGTSSSYGEPRLKILDGTFFKYLPEESTSQNIVALCMKCLPIEKNSKDTIIVHRISQAI